MGIHARSSFLACRGLRIILNTFELLGTNLAHMSKMVLTENELKCFLN